MANLLRASGKMIVLTEKVFTRIQKKATAMKVNGKMIRLTDQDKRLGNKLIVALKVISNKIANREKAISSGRMVATSEATF